MTFIECHDDYSRFLYPRDGGDYSQQLLLATGCLFSLQGIPCLYYGTEQGLKGSRELYAFDYDPEKGGKPKFVREALWGKENAFDQENTLFKEIQKISHVREQEAALRYGRQYFRPVSGNNEDFGFSKEKGKIISFSRILNTREVLIVANTNVKDTFQGWTIVDARIHNDTSRFKIAYSNYRTQREGAIISGYVKSYDRNNTASDGWARRLHIELKPMEIQIVIPI